MVVLLLTLHAEDLKLNKNESNNIIKIYLGTKFMVFIEIYNYNVKIKDVFNRFSA